MKNHLPKDLLKRGFYYFKAFIILIIFYLGSSNSVAQTVVWSEDWESSNWSLKWTITNGTWEVGVPTSGPNAAHNGTNCAATVLSGNYGPNSESSMVSPAFIVPSANQNPRLRFWHWFNIAHGDYWQVKVKPVGTTAWVDLCSKNYGSGSGVWTCPSFDLSAYAGQNVQIAFYFYSDIYTDVSSGWYIDDISIITGPIVFSLPETFENGLADWNPTNGTWEVGVPTSGPNAAHGGTKCAATSLSGNYEPNAVSSLESPIFTVPSVDQNPRLRFWHWFNMARGDYWQVKVKPVGTTAWVDLCSKNYGSGSGVWTCPFFDLSAYAGQNVQLSFYFYSDIYTDVSSGWYIDDISIITGPITFSFPETWENGLGDWNPTNGTWEVGVSTSGPNTAHSGTKCAATSLSGNYEPNAASSLVSPIFTVPAVEQNPRLRFWHWFSMGGGDYWQVKVKPVGTTVWVDLCSKNYGSGSGVWTCPFFDLSAYAGQNIQLAFFFFSDMYIDVSSGWYIDDISIVTGSIVFSLPETFENGLGDWNPTNGTWQVGVPKNGPTTAHGGIKCAATVLSGNYEPNAASSLVSPIFTVPAVEQNPRLRFWHWFSMGGGDYWQVKVKPVGNTAWVDLSSKQYGTGSGVWTYPLLDLSAYAGQNVQLSFDFSSDRYTDVSSGWYIDDISIVTGPIVFSLPESFENGLGDWNPTNGSWEVGVPTSGPKAAHGGTKCAATSLSGNYGTSSNSALVSPVFTVPAANQNPRLRFWHWFSFTYNDYWQVKIKPAGSTAWIDLSGQQYGNGSGVWTYPSFDLSVYAGQEVQIVFSFSSDIYTGESSGWYIDDISIVTGPIVFSLPETFENGLGDWNPTNGTWEVGVPTSGPNAAHGGTKCAATSLSGNYGGTTGSMLVSPIFMVPALDQNPRLRFWHWFDFTYNDYWQVKIKPTNSTAWIDLSGQQYGNGSGVWTYPSFDLSAYAGQEIQIAFSFSSDIYGSESSGWYIDDISIVTGPIVFSLPETFENGLGDWNPTNGTWEVGVPTSGPNAAHGGIKCAATSLSGNYGGTTGSMLVSPIFMVPALDQNPRLRFWHWFNFTYNDYWQVKIKPTNSTAWSDLSGQQYGNGSGVWAYPSFDLSAYAGQEVQIAFSFSSDIYGSESSGWYIDDISIVNEIISGNATTFTVDMSTAKGFDPGKDTVYISGTFPDAGWSIPGSNPSMRMTRIGNSFVYSVTLQLTSGNYQYKYYKNSGLTGAEWTGSTNRSFKVNPPLTIEDTWGGTLSFYNLQSPASGIINPWNTFCTVSARAGIPNNKTGSGGPAYGLTAWIGYSTENTHPATWNNWIPASYSGASGSYDEFRTNLGPGIPSGTYFYASRFKLGNSNYVYGGYNGGSWNYTTNKSGIMAVDLLLPHGVHGVEPAIGVFAEKRDSVKILAYPIKPDSKVIFYNKYNGYWYPDSVAFIDSLNIKAYLNFEKAKLGVYNVMIKNKADTIRKENAYSLLESETPFGIWVDFEGETGKVFASGVLLPTAERIYCMVKKETHVDYSSTWQGGINIYYHDSIEFSKSHNTGDDILLTFKNVEAGYYPFEIYFSLNKSWKGKIKFCLEPESLILNQWNKGEILRPYGYDWKVFELTDNVDSLTVQTEGFGMWSGVDVYYGYIENITDHWNFGNYPGYHIKGTIKNAKKGKYYIRYMDSAVLWDNNVYAPNQKRDYLIYVGTGSIIPDSPQELAITKLSTDKLGKAISTVQVFEQGIRKTDQICLSMENEQDIVGNRFDTLMVNGLVYVQFDTSAATEGDWYVSVLRNNQIFKFENVKVNITDDHKININFEIIAPDIFRVGRFQPLIVRLTNKGRNDLHLIPVTLTLPKGILVEVRNLQKLEFDTINDIIDPNKVSIEVENKSNAALNDITLIIPFLAPGQIYELVFWLNPQTSGKFDYIVFVDDPLLYPNKSLITKSLKSLKLSVECIVCQEDLYRNMSKKYSEKMREEDISQEFQNDFNACLEGMSSNTPEDWLKLATGGISFFINPTGADRNRPSSYTKYQLDQTLKILDCTKAASNFIPEFPKLKGFLENIVDGLGYVEDAVDFWNCYDVCKDDKKDDDYPKRKDGGGDGKGSTTPEDKYGPVKSITTINDSISVNYIDTAEVFEYRIDYWNKEDATAPAAIVYIRDTLDTDFNLKTFNFTEVGFMKWKLKLEGGHYFNVNVDCRPEMPYIVNVEGTLNPETREVYIVHTTLDPITTELPEDPMSGYLPPIDSTGYQLGWVNYTVEANDSLPDGTIFTNQAFVNFDGVGRWGPAPKECPYTSIFDLSSPVSKMLPVSLICEKDSVLLKWTGKDSGSGIKDFSIYVSEANNFYAWKINISDTAGFFKGEPGKTYKFYCIARDRVGNVEPSKQVYEATVTFITVTNTQSLSFSTGWNIFSFNKILNNVDLKAVFQFLIDNGSLIKIQDENGDALEDLGVFGGWTNNIGGFSLTDGYKIKVNTDCQLLITGTPAALPYKIPLKPGWNIIGYPKNTESDGLAVVQQLIDRGKLIKVQDDQGNSIEDWGLLGGWVNNTGNFKPGEGYKIKVNANDTLTIYESYTKSSSSPISHINQVHFKPATIGNGVDHMNINLVNIPDGLLQEGDEIGVFDGNLCVGAVKCSRLRAQSSGLSMAVTANDGIGDQGFKEGNPFTLKIWKAQSNLEYLVEPEIIKGSPTYLKHETTFASLAKYSAFNFGKDNVIIEPDLKIYPNPTDGNIYISAGNMSLKGSKVQVVNALGQVILQGTIDSDPGKFSLSGYVRGVYYIRITGGCWSKTEKIILR